MTVRELLFRLSSSLPERPFAPVERGQRVAPFALAAILCLAAYVGFSGRMDELVETPTLWAGGALAMGVIVAGLFAPWERLPQWLDVVPPLAFLAAIFLLTRTADGESEFLMLSVLPMAWLAMFHRARDLLIGTVVFGFLLGYGVTRSGGHTLGVVSISVVIAIFIGAAVRGLVLRLDHHARQRAAGARLGEVALSRSVTLEGLMEEAVHVVAAALEVEFAKVLLVEGNGAWLRLAAGVGWDEGTVGKVVVDSGLASQAGYTLMADGPVVTCDVNRDPRFSPPPLLVRHSVRGGVSVVIRDDGATLGVLGAHSRRWRRFTDEDADLMQSVATVLGSAIARERHRARFEALASNPHNVMAVVDDQGLIGFVTEGIEAMLGHDPAALIGTSLFDLEHPDDVARAKVLFAEMIEGQRNEAVWQARSRHVDGAPRWLDMLMTDHRDDPAIGGLVAIVRDVTDSRKAVSAWSEMFDKSLDLMCVAGFDGFFKQLNPRWSECLGHTNEELLAAPFIDFVHPDDREDTIREAGRLQEGFDTLSFENRYRCTDGTYRRLLWRATASQESGYIFAVARDITDERQLELQLRQAQKMEAVGRLAGGVAHDFNNLLAVILNYAYFLREDLEPDDPRLEDVEEIQSASERGARLVAQLLAFSRKEVLQLEPLDPAAVLNGMRRLLERTLGEDVELVFRIGGDLPRITADRGNLDQIIMNLAVNARDAMPQGGRLEIEAQREVLTAELVTQNGTITPGTYLRLTVGDDGEGMESEIIAHIFEPFFTTKERGQGTGLGLATVYGIVEEAGGHVVVTSVVGEGTEFSIYWPEGGDMESTAEGTVSQPVESGAGRVLVVEDEPAVRKMIARILGRAGYEVAVAEDGEDAIARARENGPVDLVLSDIIMPKVSGKELVARLHASGYVFRTLFMSGYADNVILDHGGLDPGEYFIQKPFTARALLTKIEEVLSPSGAPSALL